MKTAEINADHAIYIFFFLCESNSLILQQVHVLLSSLQLEQQNLSLFWSSFFLIMACYDSPSKTILLGTLD